MQEYDSYFDYWLNTSEYVCECCKNSADWLVCDETCPKFYTLTPEQVKEKGYRTDIQWTCQNTDDMEFCELFQNSICGKCLDNFNNFSSNGLIK